MVAYGDVRKWKAEPLHDSVGQVNTLCTALVGLSDEVSDAEKTNRWHGEAANGAANNLNSIRGGVEDLISEVAAMRTAVGEAADGVSGLMNGVAEAETLAGKYYIRIDDFGTLHDADFGFPSDDARIAWERDRNRIKAELTDRITEIIRRADDIDNDLNCVVSKCLEAGGIGDPAYDGLTEAARAGGEAGHLSTLEPPRGTPAANAAWWSTLGEAEKTAIMALHPDWIGNLDGIPAEVRDDANRKRIAGEYDRLRGERDQILADIRRWSDPRYAGQREVVQLLDSLNDKLANINTKFDALGDIHTMLAREDRQLLMLDTTGERVKAAVAVGNVDTADHVAVFTPGKGSTVNDRMEGYDNDMAELRGHAEDEILKKTGQEGSVAVVTWLNYEPPLDFVDAGLPGRAEDGAAKLTSFLNGIDASRADDPHLTALGHSYGSYTTGLALRGHTTGVDDMVVFGSPGIGAMDPSQQVPSGHAYNLAAQGDPVAGMGAGVPWFGLDPRGMPGMDQLSTEAYTAPDGTPLEASRGHSEYVNADGRYTTSEWNMANVIAGTGITH